MAYKLSESMSVDVLIVYLGARVAVFSAPEAPEGLAAPWKKLLATARKVRDERDDARIHTAAMEANARLVDARWDKEVFDLAGVALLASNRDPKAPPYSLLFGSMNASRARELGVHKATAFGADLVESIEKLDHPGLVASGKTLATRNVALEDAGKKRLAATVAERAHDIVRVQLLADVEKQIALTEVELLKRFPGDEALVSAYLRPDDKRRGVASEDEVPAAA